MITSKMRKHGNSYVATIPREEKEIFDEKNRLHRRW